MGFAIGAVLLIIASVKAVQIGEFVPSAIYFGFIPLMMLFIYRAEDLLIEKSHAGFLRITNKSILIPARVIQAEIKRINGIEMIPISIGRNPNFTIRLKLSSPEENIEISKYPISKRWQAEQIVQKVSRVLKPS